MPLKPIVRMWERVDVGRSDSNTTLFSDLMYLGELLTKLTVTALAAAIDDDPERSRYRQLFALVRADGIGDWANVLTEILTGPPSQHLLPEARTEQRELTHRVGPDTWQYVAAAKMADCLRIVDPQQDPLPAKLDGAKLFRDLARLRNKTRGHGAPSASVLGELCPVLEESLRAFSDNFALFRREWVYLHRNLSGKYRVTKLGESSTRFDDLKQSPGAQYPNGIYVHFDRPVRVELVESDVDASDFYFANGSFNDKRYEMLSYATGDSIFADSGPYLAPATSLPASETQGLGDLSLLGNCFTNIPSPPTDYVKREVLEKEVVASLCDDRHPIVTLLGRGGIGKTSLALAALHHPSVQDRFDVILWFSARDLDLLPEGPKRVKPAMLSVKDMAKEYVKLTNPSAIEDKSFKPVEHLAASLTLAGEGRTLFVLDNFETVSNPGEFFRWIDTYIRNPNKVLITTRHRDFKGDYPIEVYGMSESECSLLIDSVATKFSIRELLSLEYRQEVFRESEGHPYVVKILLGEVAKARKLIKIERIVADADEILTALFERTYATLSPAAQRVFLTLCNWRATIPRLAIEAVLLRTANEKISVGEAVEELERSSFIELLQSKADGEIFVSTPLIAAVFGKRKLAVSPMKSAIEADTAMLYDFGAAQKTDVRHGLAPRVERLIAAIARKVGFGKKPIDEYLPMLQFIARHHLPAWLQIAALYEEMGTEDGIERAKEAVRNYLEVAPNDASIDAWKRLADLCRRTNDTLGEVHALIGRAGLPGVAFEDVSFAANRLNLLLANKRREFESEEKVVLVRRLVAIMERRLDEADATACSRLAWLCFHLPDLERAKEHVMRGLELDPSNEYCNKLSRKLSFQQAI